MHKNINLFFFSKVERTARIKTKRNNKDKIIK